jgi:hypothetical protein
MELSAYVTSTRDSSRQSEEYQLNLKISQNGSFVLETEGNTCPVPYQLSQCIQSYHRSESQSDFDGVATYKLKIFNRTLGYVRPIKLGTRIEAYMQIVDSELLKIGVPEIIRLSGPACGQPK